MRRSGRKKAAPDDAPELEEICSRLDAIIQRSTAIEGKLRDIEDRKRHSTGRSSVRPTRKPVRASSPLDTSPPASRPDDARSAGVPRATSPSRIQSSASSFTRPPPRPFDPPPRRSPTIGRSTSAAVDRSRLFDHSSATDFDRPPSSAFDRPPSSAFGRPPSSEFGRKPLTNRKPSPSFGSPPRTAPPSVSPRPERPPSRVEIKTDGPVTLSDLYCAILSLQQQVADVAATQREMRAELAALRNRSST
jgi:hypothetical protein